MMKKAAITIIVILTLSITSAVTLSLSSGSDESDRGCKDKMISLLSELHDYAKKKDPDFNMITNGGYGLYCPSVNTSADSREKFLENVDAILIEDVFYGWDCKMNRPSPAEESSRMKESISYAVKCGKVAFNMEYTNEPDEIRKATEGSERLGSICYAAPDIDLNRIAKLPEERKNVNDVRDLHQVKNFMALLDPGEYEKKMDKNGYIKELQKTDYDLIFIDLFYRSEALTKADVDKLREKANGKKRLVCTYISVGEAERYRYYWKSSWDSEPPEWIADENPEWEENYVVKYWDPEWKKILYGSSEAYLDRALAAGFDGAYLDVIDAYEKF